MAKGAQALGGVNSFAVRQHAATAHFPGTGPDGKHCADCQLMVMDRTKFKCGKWGKLMHPHVTLAKTPSIPGSTDACKYFEQRAAKPKAYKKSRR